MAQHARRLHPLLPFFLRLGLTIGCAVGLFFAIDYWIDGRPIIHVDWLPTRELDLSHLQSALRLAEMLRPSDTVVMLSASAMKKGRDTAGLIRNLTIGESVCRAVASAACAHVIYLSSDSVYPFGPDPITEADMAAAAEAASSQVADKIAADATSVTDADIDALRAHGLSDPEILDVVLAAAVRCFYSKTLDALGVEPDPTYNALTPSLRDALTLGRPIEAA